MLTVERHRPVAGASPQSPVEALLRAHHAVGTRLEDVLAIHGLSVAKLGILRQLSQGPLPLGALAQRQSCVRSNITQLIDRMETEGLVRRRADCDDRRVTLAEITEAGRARLAAGLAAQSEVERMLLATFSAADVDTLVALLGKLAAAV